MSLKRHWILIDFDWIKIKKGILKDIKEVDEIRMHNGWSEYIRCVLLIEVDCWC